LIKSYQNFKKNLVDKKYQVFNKTWLVLSTLPSFTNF